jgi:hypothetical protein
MASSLRIVTLPFDPSESIPIETFAVNPSLKEIRLILPAFAVDDSDYSAHFIHLEPRLRGLLVFQPARALSVRSRSLADIPYTYTSSPSNPLFVPMAHIEADVRDKIWDRILRLALDVDISGAFVDGICLPLLRRLAHTRKSLPLGVQIFRSK